MRAFRGVLTRLPARATALVAVALCVVTLSAGAQRDPSSPAKPTFDELYRRGQQANAGIETLTARFTETTTSALLEKPIEARGTLYVHRPSRVALHYSEPAGRLVVIDGNRMITSWPSRKLHTSSDIGATQKRVQRYFTASDAGELRRIFDIELREATERPGTREVLMVPKRKQISEALSRLELWVKDPSGLLEAMRMTFSNGDTKLMEFSDVMPNAPVDAAVFSAPR